MLQSSISAIAIHYHCNMFWDLMKRVNSCDEDIFFSSSSHYQRILIAALVQFKKVCGGLKVHCLTVAGSVGSS
jgi:hypothetical protein